MDIERLKHKPTREEINALPLRYYEGKVTIIRNRKQWQKALPDLREHGILGFDTETKPTFRKGKPNSPALIQLASAREVYLIQLGWWPFGEDCAKLLSDSSIIKVGVGINLDLTALRNLYSFEPAGIVDLGEVAQSNDLPAQGIRTLAAILFGWRISKSSQCSNWNLANLSAKQIAYAATDAWISRMIYLRLKELGLMKPIQKCPQN